MTFPPGSLAARLLDQADRLHQLAHAGAAPQVLILHAAQLALSAIAADALAADLARATRQLDDIVDSAREAEQAGAEAVAAHNRRQRTIDNLLAPAIPCHLARRPGR